MTNESPDPYPTQADIDVVVAELSSNLREAIRTLLHDVAVFAKDNERSVSRGYVRGHLAELGNRRALNAK